MSDVTPDAAPQPVRCDGCGTQLAPSLIVCPLCHALVHRDQLATLAAAADEAERAGLTADAIARWRQALPLLPPGSRQYETVAKKIDVLATAVDRDQAAAIAKGPSQGTKWAKILAPLGVAGLLIWKLKFLVIAILSKAKLLLLGFTKAGTMATMFLSLGLYWKLWGWKFAAALIASIYIHEIGHVAALRRRGIAAGAPTFIPGFGAFVRMHEHASTPSEDAKIGLAGPWWGLGASLAALIVSLITGLAFWSAIAKWSAYINLFNLTPVWQLDGSRGFSALSRQQRWLAVAVLGIAFAVTGERLAVVVGAVAIWRAFEKSAPREPNWTVFAEYAFLALVLSAFAWVPVRI